MSIAKLKKRAGMAGMTLYDHQIGLSLYDNLHGQLAAFFWNTANQGRKVFRKHEALELTNKVIEAYSRGWTPFKESEAKRG